MRSHGSRTSNLDAELHRCLAAQVLSCLGQTFRRSKVDQEGGAGGMGPPFPLSWAAREKVDLQPDLSSGKFDGEILPPKLGL